MRGATPPQLRTLREIVDALCEIGPGRRGSRVTWHHGDCAGADAQSHDIAYDAGCHVVVHPPSDPKKRAFVHQGPKWDHRCSLLPAEPYLVRNRAMVDSSLLTVATPKEPNVRRPRGDWTPVRYSGTWSTIRYAEAMFKPAIVIWPDGNVEHLIHERGWQPLFDDLLSL